MGKNYTVIDNSTGEIVENVIVKDKERFERAKAFFKRQSTNKEKFILFKTTYVNNGDFVWFDYSPGSDLQLNIKTKDLFRLMYLATYINYNGILKKNNSTYMDKKSMFEIVGGSHKAFECFYNDLIHTKILINRTGLLYLNKKYFRKGNLRNNKDLNNNKYVVKIFNDGIRELYRNSNPDDYKTISYVFKLIPYIDINTNMICLNPIRYGCDEIVPASLEKICEMTGYSATNKFRLKSSLSRFSVGKNPIIEFIGKGENMNCFVSPDLICAVKDPNEIKLFIKNIRNFKTKAKIKYEIA